MTSKTPHRSSSEQTILVSIYGAAGGALCASPLTCLAIVYYFERRIPSALYILSAVCLLIGAALIWCGGQLERIWGTKTKLQDPKIPEDELGPHPHT
jgi:hypothetical protein